MLWHGCRECREFRYGIPAILPGPLLPYPYSIPTLSPPHPYPHPYPYPYPHPYLHPDPYPHPDPHPNPNPHPYPALSQALEWDASRDVWSVDTE